MKFGAYWFRLKKKNPGLNDPESRMTLTVAGFEKALKQSFEVGKEEGRTEKGKNPFLSNPFGP